MGGKRRVRLVVLCEDPQHQAFARRLLVALGWDRRQLRVEQAPIGRGAAEQWVREQVPREVKALRSKPHIGTALIVMVDADRFSVAERLKGFEKSLEAAGSPHRQPDEPIAWIVPRRNIECWIRYLQGDAVDEGTSYPKLLRPRDCEDAVAALAQMCQSRQLHASAPPSLREACEEFRQRVPTPS